jgi:hypothetical protein
MAGIDFDTVAGTKLYVSIAAPATNTAAGYAALTWTEIGQITNVGGVLGREYNTATMETVGDAQVREKKGNFKLPNAEFECAWAESDAGQIILAAAANDFTTPSFKLVKQNGTSMRYFTAQVMKFVENLGGANDAVKGAFTLLRQRDTITA